MTLSKKVRDWVKRRDEGKCRFPVWNYQKKRYEFCLSEGKQEVHHIYPNRFSQACFGKTFDIPTNLILLCTHCHHRVHPDVLGALKLYRTNKNSFKLMFQERERLVALGRPYWMTMSDLLFLRIAKIRTFRYIRQHPDDPFPY